MMTRRVDYSCIRFVNGLAIRRRAMALVIPTGLREATAD
jgi:hypothetical protein